jgi:uncharacterized protein YndB with AHSA1/START domain
MAQANIVARAEIDIDATPSRVWDALTDREQIKRYMFGSEVTTDWQAGSPITWKGEYDGNAYEDKGEVVEVDEQRRLVVTHFSPLSGGEDVPENYHTLTYELGTHLSLSQDGNGSDEEANHARANWERMLEQLKHVVESDETS